MSPKKNTQKPKKRKKYAYTATLYTQLLNGTRICEAVRAIREFAKNRQKRTQHKTLKKEKTRNKTHHNTRKHRQTKMHMDGR
jgi:type II secretory pathway component PulF